MSVPRLAPSSTTTFVDYFRVPGNPYDPEINHDKKFPSGKQIVSQHARLLNKANNGSGAVAKLDPKVLDRRSGGFPNARVARAGAAKGSLKATNRGARSSDFPKRV